MDIVELQVGDRVRHKYLRREIGTVVNVWDGIYHVDYYDGDQYNPYRITVKIDEEFRETPEEEILYYKPEALEIITQGGKS